MQSLTFLIFALSSTCAAIDLAVIFSSALAKPTGTLITPAATGQLPCDWACFQDSPPPGSKNIACPAGLPTSMNGNSNNPIICVCGGSGVVECEVCGLGVVPGTALAVCNCGSPPPPPPPPPTSCYTSTPYREPTATAGKKVPSKVHDKIYEAAELASIAYCVEGIVTGPFPAKFQCQRFCMNYKNFLFLDIFDSNAFAGISGYIAVDSKASDPRIIVSIRGTNNRLNWVEDFFLSQSLFPATYESYLAQNCHGCTISDEADYLGITALNYVTPLLASAIQKYPCHRIEIIGHSLGGVIAELLGVAYRPYVDLEVITFGQPRVGNAAWAFYVDNLLVADRKFYRVTHYGDPVCRLPDRNWGFEHHGTEYWIPDDISNKASAIYKCVFDEDPSCAEGQGDPDLNQLINDFYFPYGALSSSSNLLVENRLAESLHKRELELSTRFYGSEDADTLISVNNVGAILKEPGRYEEAWPYFLQATNGHKKVLGSHHPETLYSTIRLAETMPEEKLNEALTLARKSVTDLDDTLGPEHPYTYKGVLVLAELLWKEKKFHEAEAMLREALEFHRSRQNRNEIGILNNMQVLAFVLRDNGDLVEAERCINMVIEEKTKRFGVGSPILSSCIDIHRSIMEAKNSALGLQSVAQE